MADNASRLSLTTVRAAVDHVQTEGERLLTRLRRDTEALLARRRRQVVAEVLGTTRRVEADIRQRAERALRDLDGRRAQLLATLEKQAGGLVETLIKRLNVASQEEIADIEKRLAGVERRVGAIATVPNVPTRDEVAELRKRIAELELRLDTLLQRVGDPRNLPGQAQLRSLTGEPGRPCAVVPGVQRHGVSVVVLVVVALVVVVVRAAQRVLLVPTVPPAVWQLAAEAAMLLTVRATTVPRPCPFPQDGW